MKSVTTLVLHVSDRDILLSGRHDYYRVPLSKFKTWSKDCIMHPEHNDVAPTRRINF